jgi:peptide/nickel transport system permease protein
MPPIPFHPTKVWLEEYLLPPGEQGHILGTDNLGHDILARIVHGTRIALSVGIVAMGIAAVIGIILGSLAGYFGGTTDIIISRLIEIVICFPMLFLILTVLAFLPPSIYNIMIVIGITGWTGIARLVRGEILKVREMDYVKAARASGLPDLRILWRHVLPNSLAPVLVSISFGIAGSILTETSLSFLGFGVQPPDPSWGQILSLAREYPTRMWLAIYPGLAIFITVIGYNMVGEALRDALDPRLARTGSK